MKRLIYLIVSCLIVSQGYAQKNIISGKITGANKEPLSGVSLTIKGTTTGTISDGDGQFKLAFNQNFPVVVQVSSIGYLAIDSTINHAGQFDFYLTERPYQMDLTLAATRVATNIIAAPVTIERIGLAAIEATPAASAYNALSYQKGIDIITSSLTFNTPSTRGFNGSGNTRVNQWVDGMDNQAPGMNFAVGNFAGVTDLDMESIELLPGASSALYGPGGMGGTIIINSKNPFKYQGLSVSVKEGVMNVDKRNRPDVTGYHDWAIRYARAIKDKFAFKVGAQYIKATDWLAPDTLNYNRNLGKLIEGTRATDPNYDGINVYGDETSFNIQPFIPAAYRSFFPGRIDVSRTGYAECEVIDPATKNLKLFGAVHYRLNNQTEASISGKWGTGNTVYTGSDRYVLQDIQIGQYKIEIKNRSWFVRGYTTQESAGNSYSATTLMRYFNEVWKPSEQWYPTYVNTYVGAVLTGVPHAKAHMLARAAADAGRPAPGSEQFKQIYNRLKAIPISKGGGLFVDHSNLYMAEAQFNLNRLNKLAEVVVGGNYKKYLLNSEGTIFIDTLGKIGVNEVGAYVQATRRLLDGHLTLAAIARYDKNQNFSGNVTPRFSAVIKLADNNNIRVSYQTAYKFPSTQQQFIKLQIASNIYLLGGLPWILDYMNHKSQSVVQVTSAGMQPYTYKEFKPEKCRSFEVGYKGIIEKKWMVDVYGYKSSFINFLGRINLLQPANGTIYSVVVNSEAVIKTQGMGASINYQATSQLSLHTNFFTDDISNVPTDFTTNFNTPKFRLNAGATSSGLGKNKRFGFGVQCRWQSGFDFENDFANGYIKPFTTLDAQVNYKVLKNIAELRIGGNNLLNQYYKNGYGSPEIGGLYYAAVNVNIR